ncbi:uncharacterized protein DFL_000323 [Arthrobotrys flagrans]|uniref:PNPLA domain-containing protein n=1 Tax=Arthrobotrys flagrans TaxID=97331 RepID=A0A437ADE9_ARTFL|nr:hypothetical protein DFL_000323 [Arthrobotrys flagrans]
MASLQLPRAGRIPRPQIDALPPFKLSSVPLKDGTYRVKHSQSRKSEPRPEDVTSINAEIWFRSPALDEVTIRKIDSIQLFAESHDQGFCNNEDLGNWTWFELGIYENEEEETPRSKDGIELIWRSHYNNFKSDEYKWCEGNLFEETHDLVRNLEPGNCIGVRLISRFQAWAIYARNGYLVFKIGDETLDRKPPPRYEDIISGLDAVQEAISDVNAQNNAVFMPTISGGLYRGDAFGTSEERPLRVLSLDGGGVRGLVTLRLLKAVFEKACITQHPYQVFDMIGGTSTGGLIAIMLGRLKMSLDECIAAYLKVMGKIFPQTSKFEKCTKLSGDFYDEKTLEDAIKEIVGQKLGDPEAQLLDKDLDEKNPDNDCKIFVMAVRADKVNNRGPVFLRSYPNQVNMPEFPDIKVWEAARATSAAPAYFKPLSIGGVELLDGGLGANNPLGWLWTEMLSVFGPARPTSTFLTIGTGMPSNVGVKDPGNIFNIKATLDSFVSIATNTELTHILFRTLVNAFAPHARGKKYFRLNVGKYIGDWEETEGHLWWRETVHHYDDWAKVGKLDDVEALKPLMVLAEQYIKDNETLFGECATSLKEAVKMKYY